MDGGRPLVRTVQVDRGGRRGIAKGIDEFGQRRLRVRHRWLYSGLVRFSPFRTMNDIAAFHQASFAQLPKDTPAFDLQGFGAASASLTLQSDWKASHAVTKRRRMVPPAELEPAHPYGQQILRPPV